MYTFSSKLKTFSFVLMAVGLLGIGYGFLTAPKDIQEVEKLLAAETHEGHGEAKHEVAAATTEAHNEVSKTNEVKEEAEHKEHVTHVLKQLQNKPWASLYVACIFFMLMAMGVLAFYAIQQVAQAG
ncbi:MAG TPA: quinol:cytochrome C oxidoreductase, partial [Flavobacterium sp.]